MKNLITKKSAFVVSMYHRKVTPIANPKPNEPKYDLSAHDYHILIIDSVEEMITLLDRYTDFDKNMNGDYLAKKETLKGSFIVTITEMERLKKEVLWDKAGWIGEGYFEKAFNEHYLDIKRLPIGLEKRYHLEDLV